MTPKARAVLKIMSFDDLENYDRVKQHMLEELKLMLREYRSKFVDARKTMEET